MAIAITALCGICLVGLGLLQGVPSIELPWIEAWKVSFALRLDALALLFCLLICGTGIAILAFSAPYMHAEQREHRSERRLSSFYACLLFFLGSMLGLVCADELFTLYLFWEATSASSFLLIGWHLRERHARDAAVQAFTITAGAGLLLFLAFVAIAAVAGTTHLDDLDAMARAVAASPLAPWIALGLLLGAVAKSALVPLHLWLPNAMVAPTPVSAWLHSATMVAAGVFLLARIAPLHGALPGFSSALIALGIGTMLVGGAVACVRHRLKAILAWSTISQYGYVTMLLGLGAWGAATFVIASHAVIKAGLFLVAGHITQATGQKDLRRLGGLRRSLPITAATTTILGLGLAGLPLTSGFWMKELIYEAALHSGLGWLFVATFATGLLTFVYVLRLIASVFGGETVESEARERPALWLPPAALALLSVAVGLVPGPAGRLTDRAAAAASGTEVHSHLAIGWPLPPAAMASLATFVLGFGIWRWIAGRRRVRDYGLPPVHPLSDRPALPPGTLLTRVVREIGPMRVWREALPGLDRFSHALGRLQSGKLVHYLVLLVAVPVVAAGILLPQVDAWPAPPPAGGASRGILTLGTLSLAAIGLALAAATVRSHIASILMIGLVGFVLTLIFSLLRAPDVALVQVAVETVLAILLLMVLSRIRHTLREAAMSARSQRHRASRAAAVIASCTVGVTVTATSLALQANLGDPSLSQSFFPLAAERKVDAVVTAILVDFRGLDTFGEITVFAAAALGTVLLLARDTSGARSGRASDA